MSIRRITDLPFLSSGSDGSGNFSQQFLSSALEISYLSVDLSGNSTGKYESKAMRCGDFIDQILADIKLNPTRFYGKKYFYDGIDLYGGLSLSGNLSVNVDSYCYSQYAADLRFGNIDFTANQHAGLSAYDQSVLKGGSGSVTVKTNPGTMQGLVELADSATVNSTISTEGKSVVNMNQLMAQLAALSAKIIEEIGSGGKTVQPASVPLLSFVYLDHEITDSSWKKAGSKVDLTKYSQLYQHVLELKSQGKLRLEGSGKTNDTWYYSLADEKLTLPSTKWFIQGGTSVGFNEAGLPNHTHGVRICGKDGSSSSHGRRGNDNSGEDAIMQSYVASNSIYGKSDTVQPNATTMFIYFYVGPKD